MTFEQRANSPHLSRDIALAMLIGLLSGTVAYGGRTLMGTPGDLMQALRPASDFVMARPMLSWPTDVLYVPSPLTIIPIGLPFVGLPPIPAAALFVGLTGGALALALMRRGEYWRLTMFLSYPYVTNVLVVQYVPLLMTLTLISAAPLGLLIKPHIALPFVLAYKARGWSWFATFGLGIASLLIFGLWPLKWLEQLRPYQGAIPALGLFGLIAAFLSLSAIRQPEGRLVFFAMIMPSRSHYDLLGMFLIPRNIRQMLLLTTISYGMFVMIDWPISGVLFGFLPAAAIAAWNARRVIGPRP